MPEGKPAGVRCVQLTDDHRCALFGKPERPDVCNRLRASVEMCGTTAREAYDYLQRRLKLGYSRAARLIEIMEANGIVGPSQGSKPREILIRADDYPSANSV